MNIDATFRLRRGGFELDVVFSLPLQGVTAIFGPSGCGKTTLLRALAGLESVDGHCRLGERVWQQGRQRLPTHRRTLGYVFQEASLFPHLSVEDNLLYGWKRLPAERRRIVPGEVVEWMGLADLLRRPATELSGGQRQRVAIGRALLTSPEVLLLDEPLSALDRQARQQILPYLEQLSAESGVPMFYVTHAADEVERLADRVIFMAHGRIERTESLQQALGRADSPLFVDEGAASILEGKVGATLADGRTPFLCRGLRLWLVRPLRRAVTRARLRILASDVSLALRPLGDISIVNQLELRISRIDPPVDGRVLVCGLLADGQQLSAEISAYSAAQLKLHEGQQVYALIKAVALLD
ncbi:molybdenum import ATP-binding protein ModC [Marinobacterium nitratireducens]|uniref:Molybdenum import ATP-binding protein ModC n=1 Tax=Marinobacterium nitratireducens TaxID=518897 RepID=A0A917Z823_9GAMM|nr:molybdenum ABC transporter ATP-binding protein [Marinobacterium nitratireducens]GGO77307.1 molybdenum import ATP-binding protein ModC [Marinobacterium nitratireducens]